jgi:hypothetical protein
MIRAENILLKGVNWWPLFTTIQWDYRENPDRPLTEFIREGGWNNGLYRVDTQAGAELKRLPTKAVEAFQQMVQRDKWK